MDSYPCMQAWAPVVFIVYMLIDVRTFVREVQSLATHAYNTSVLK